MLGRYSDIKKFLPKLGIKEVTDLIPTMREQRKIDQLTTLFEDLDSVTKSLQRSNITCSQVRTLFDGVVSEYPSTASRLSSTARIVHSLLFESAIVKLQEQRFAELSSQETSAVAALKKQHTTNGTNSEDVRSYSFAERLLKRRRTETVEQNYLDTRFLTPTSNVCERLFSKAGYALT